MTLKYTLTEDDYLQHQLYIASKTNRIKKKRRQSWITMVFVFVALTVLLFQTDNILLSFYFGVLSILTLIFYPFYLKKHYKKHYQKIHFRYL